MFRWSLMKSKNMNDVIPFCLEDEICLECLCEVQFTEWSFVRCKYATLIESPKGPSNWTTPSRCTPGKVENLV